MLENSLLYYPIYFISISLVKYMKNTKNNSLAIVFYPNKVIPKELLVNNLAYLILVLSLKISEEIGGQKKKPIV